MQRLLTRAVDRYLIRKTAVWLEQAQARISSPCPDLASTTADPGFYALPGETAVSVIPGNKSQAWDNLSLITPVPSPFRENNTCPVRFYRCPGTALATTIIIHGWASHSLRLYERNFCQPLLRNGSNCLLPVLPYHMERKPPGTFDGEYMVSSDLAKSLAALRQAVLETKALIRWLRQTTSCPIGVLGISLGGLVAGLVAATEPELDFSLFLVPAADPARILWDSPLCTPIRRKLGNSGVGHRQVADYCQVAVPSAYPPAISRDRILFLLARHDLCIEPDWIRGWARQWSCPNLRDYNHSHISSLFSRRIRRDIVGFIRQQASSAG